MRTDVAFPFDLSLVLAQGNITVKTTKAKAKIRSWVNSRILSDQFFLVIGLGLDTGHWVWPLTLCRQDNVARIILKVKVQHKIQKQNRMIWKAIKLVTTDLLDSFVQFWCGRWFQSYLAHYDVIQLSKVLTKETILTFSYDLS